MVTGYVWLERYGWHDTGMHAGFSPSGPVVRTSGMTRHFTVVP
jgi:hypothetical protein